MKKNFVFALIACCFFLFSHGQKQADNLSEDRPVSGFHTVRVATGISAILVKEDREKLTISASTAVYRDRIRTQVKDSVLYIYYEEPKGASSFKKKKEPEAKLKASISYKTIKKVFAETGAMVSHPSVLQADALTIVATTGAVVNMNTDIKNTTAQLGEGSIVNLKGRGESLQVKAETGSEFACPNYVVQKCDARASTGAIVTVQATSNLYARAHTGGIVRHKGAVREIVKDVQTDGIVSQIK